MLTRSAAVVVASVCAFLGSTGVGGLSGCDCDPEVDPLRPALVVDPEDAVLNGIPVAQDTPISFKLPNQRSVNLDDVTAVLTDDSDPAFRLVDGDEERVLPGQIGELIVNVRPVVEGTIEATLIVDSQIEIDDVTKRLARPNHVEVHITVNAINVGLPQIEVSVAGIDAVVGSTGVDPAAVADDGDVVVEFGTIGRADIGRANVNLKNVGVRDLLLDHVYLSDDSDPSFRISVGGIAKDATTAVNLGARDANVDVQLIFQPQDTDRHTGTLIIESNDTDPLSDAHIEIPLTAQAVECPVAIARLVDEGIEIAPFDTVRIDGQESHAVAPGTQIMLPPDGYEWSMLVRPIGSTAVLASETSDRTEFEADLAGLYQVQLDVFANDPSRPNSPKIRSCLPAIVDVNVVPLDDLHVQLVWDHPDADLDLHILNEDGNVFTHEGDCYFSNRQPLAPDTPGPWSVNPDRNPRLDVDDDEGYGPENVNLKHPAPGSKWTIFVHYWNKQTAGAPDLTAIVRVFVYGSQAIELQQAFTDDQQMWHALELVWGDDELAPPTLSQLGVVEPFPRPF